MVSGEYTRAYTNQIRKYDRAMSRDSDPLPTLKTSPPTLTQAETTSTFLLQVGREGLANWQNLYASMPGRAFWCHRFCASIVFMAEQRLDNLYDFPPACAQ